MNVNIVQLIGHYGSDRTHAQSAWTSTERDITEAKSLRIPDLLKMLATEGHHTPFEKSSLHFLVTCDQASHIHLLKHRIGVSINAESARYKELKEDKTYFPTDWVVSEHPVVQRWIKMLESYTLQGNSMYHQCLDDLTPIVGRKRAKESARYFKTFNSQITMDVMFNWRSFVHFQRLRNDEHAQLEIRAIAETMLRLVKAIDKQPFKHTITAFNL
jgi:flavin-dependent thymidylate synthase